MDRRGAEKSREMMLEELLAAGHAAIAGDAAVTDRIERGVESDVQDGLQCR